MEYDRNAREANNDRMAEVIFKLTGIEKNKVKFALDKYGVQKLLENPQLVEDGKADRLVDLKNIIDFLSEKGVE